MLAYNTRYQVSVGRLPCSTRANDNSCVAVIVKHSSLPFIIKQHETIKCMHHKQKQPQNAACLQLFSYVQNAYSETIPNFFHIDTKGNVTELQP